MKIIFQILLIISISFSFNKSINDKIEEQWIQLFNGKNLDGWEVKINGFPLGENAFNTFRVKNNSLVVNYDEYDNFKDYYGHIFYKNPYSNYKLKLDYRFIGDQCKGGEGWATKNSGVMIHSQSPKTCLLYTSPSPRD